MKNIFALTKNQQRIVILIVAAVLAFAVAKRYRQNLANPTPPRAETPAANATSPDRKENAEPEAPRR